MPQNISNCGAGKFVSHGRWIHPDRIIDSYEIIFVTKGEVYISESGKEYRIEQNELLLLEPGLKHFGYKHSCDCEFFWLHWYGDDPWAGEVKQRRIESSYAIVMYFHQLLIAKVLKKGSEYMDCLTKLILLEISSDIKKPAVTNPALEKAVAWIRANCNSGITERQVAAYCKYNADYLNRLFKSVYAQTIKQYIDDRRMEYIKELMLCQNVPLKEIAAKAGFPEYKYFLKYFKYHEHMTPSQFYMMHAYIPINSR